MADQKMLSTPDYGDVLKAGKNAVAGTAPDDVAIVQQVTDAYDNARSRTNHTGSQPASTISDFDTVVRLNRLDQLAAPTSAVSLNSQRATNAADPVSAQDLTTRAWVLAQLDGVASGLTLKGSARGYVTTNVNISSPGATLDGLTPVSGQDIFIFAGQSTGSQNGPWVWNGAASAMTRPPNFDTSAEAVLGSFWIIREGTSADLLAVMTNDSAVTLGTTALTFILRGNGSAAGPTKYTTTSPVVTAGGTWTITHNLNSREVIVSIRRTASPYDMVGVYEAAATVNTVTVQPDIAMASGEFTATVIG